MSKSTARSRERLETALEREGSGFEFVQAIRLLTRLYPERSPIGGWDDPTSEIVRLSVPPSLAFPPSEIASLALPARDGATEDREPASRTAMRAGARDSSAQPRMAVRFLGLTGPQGVLPHVYTEHAAARVRARDTTFRDFLDLFQHRALSLFYRAWERHRPSVAAERGEEDRLHSHLLDLVGVGTEKVRSHSALPAATMAEYAGLLMLRSRPAQGLAQLIGDYFGVPASIEQFVGEWRQLAHGGQVCLGADAEDGVLGGAVVGDAVFDTLARVRLRIGPLTRSQFDAFLPGGASHEKLRELARTYADDQVSVEAQLVLARDQRPAASLGAVDAPTLGFGTWLRSRPPVRDGDDVRLTLC